MSLSTKEITAAAGAYARQAKAAAQTNATRELFSSMLNRAAGGMKAGSKAAGQEITVDANEAGGIAGLVATSDATKDLAVQKATSQTSVASASAYASGPVFTNENYNPLVFQPIHEETRYPSAVRIHITDDGVTVEDLGDIDLMNRSSANEQHYPSRAQIVVSDDGSYHVTYYDDNGLEVSGLDTITSQPKGTDTSTTTKSKATATGASGAYASAAQILAGGGVPIKDAQDAADDTGAAQSTEQADKTTGADSSILSSLIGSDMKAEDMQTLLMYALMSGMLGAGSTGASLGDDSALSGLSSTNPAASALAAATGSLARAYQGAGKSSGASPTSADRTV